MGVFFVKGGIHLPNDFCSFLAAIDETVQGGSDALFAGTLLRSFGRRVGEMLGEERGSSDDFFFVLFDDVLTYVDCVGTYRLFLFRLETAPVMDQLTEFCERHLFRLSAWTAESHQFR